VEESKSDRTGISVSSLSRSLKGYCGVRTVVSPLRCCSSCRPLRRAAVPDVIKACVFFGIKSFFGEELARNVVSAAGLVVLLDDESPEQPWLSGGRRPDAPEAKSMVTRLERL